MMNLNKMKSKKKKQIPIMPIHGKGKWSLVWRKGMVWLGLATMFAMPTVNVLAANTSVPITIEKPDSWKQGSTTVSISVDSKGLGDKISIAKIEAKVGNGDWKDVTSRKSITISKNEVVYVRVTDSKGNVYKQNRSIRCFDSEKPTIAASLSNGILTIQGNDAVSGIQTITVNGTSYSNLNDGKLKVQLTQKDFTTKVIEMTATDSAGNVSDKYTIQNPYYEWAKKQAESKKKDDSSSSYSPTSTDTETTSSGSTEKSGTKSPLPQDGGATKPTESKGTVVDRTETSTSKIEEKTGEAVDTVTQTATEGSKVFYTITTKSGKNFYLIVDNSKQGDNVYFLTEVSEQDLMNFTLSDSVTLPDVDTVYAEKESEQEEATATEETEKAEETKEVEMPEKKSGDGSYIVIGLMAVGTFAGAYYFKIYKKKDVEDEDEFDEEYEAEYENEDEESESEDESESDEYDDEFEEEEEDDEEEE